MSIYLSSLIENIGTSVQRANKAIEDSITSIYFGQGYTKLDGKADSLSNGQEKYMPVTYKLIIPDSTGNGRDIDVPLTALLNHTSLKLESVDISLKFQMEQEGNDLCVVVKSDNNAETRDELSELNLHFKTSPASEGISRVNQKYLQVL